MEYDTLLKSVLKKRKLDSITSDFCLVVGKKKFPVHKFVLSGFSDVFDAMFRNDMIESINNKVVIKDFDAKVVEAFISCMYDKETILPNVIKNGIELMKILNKYAVTSIITEVEKLICESEFLNKFNVVEW